MKKILKLVASGAPLLIIAGLLYAGIYIKPALHSAQLQKQLFERSDRFYGVTSPDGKAVWLVGSDGKILRSNDGSATWERQVSGVSTGLQDVGSWDDKRAVVVGNGPAILRTVDGGSTWKKVDVPSRQMATKLMRVRVLPNGHAWAVGEGGLILHSADYALTWTVVGEVEDIAWNDIYFKDGHGWLVGEFGRIKVSSDNGMSWREVKSPIKSSLMSVVFRTPGNGVAVGLGGEILVSQDSGLTWAQAKSATSEHLFGLTWNGSSWVAVGDKGVVVIGANDDSTWKAVRIDPNDRAWYVSIINIPGRYFIAGARFAAINQTAL
ncbi:MAG: YCF48-related protein [Undibacterium sp.]|nr:YCF48-related protein [Undibacterium sp.]